MQLVARSMHLILSPKVNPKSNLGLHPLSPKDDSPMSHQKMPSLAMCHEFSARVSLSKIAATAGETAGAEDRRRGFNPKLISIFLRFYGI